MWKRKGRKGRRAAKPVPVELCDLCARVFPEDRSVRGYVPDSSAARVAHEWCDGLRLITACCDEHFDVIKDGYAHRPFVEEELWAAKLTRALTSGPSELSMDQLGCRTGLQEPQIRAAIAWHNERMREQQRTDP
ncbi:MULTISPECIES: hypothetical protein [Streptomyces]|jgi:hypothetical protein|uniref:HNH endonuclease n=2 Tax=Streptomyces rochei group TaxID=2867164 RepID=A0AAX3ZBT8_STRRO|nr:MULTISPECIES: hypothetical protein [Streptomyces]MDV6290708.1 hypothetical protein [Streptomyces sp. UP1A-1]WDI16663.1 hypothetical protein PS783_03390 [Streptomyces enissocaesilis]KYK13741.1 hypothetical protein AUW26_30750 [Streptomyces sp. CC71]MBQ0876603.1 hypothetical protein [Streptomyces sp. RT42]MBQ0910547.1 hypothetical protein [Streptomyces sp. RM99]